MRAFFMALVLATGVGITSAKAQEAIIVDDDDYDGPAVTEVVPYDDDDDAVAPYDGTVVVERYTERYRAPVYGWSELRPDNCGRFRYWDGDACVDARYYPPPGD